LLVSLVTISACKSQNDLHDLDLPNATPGAIAYATPAAIKTFFVPGEQLEWRITVRSIESGHMEIAAGNPGRIDERNALILVQRVEASGLLGLLGERGEEVTTTLDLGDGYPFLHRALITKGRHTVAIDARFRVGRLEITRVSEGSTAHEPRKMAPRARAFNLPTCLFALRGWQAQPGVEIWVHVLTQDEIWRGRVRYGKLEEIQTPLGNFHARRIDGIASSLTASGDPGPDEKRRFSLWYSTDKHRLPLRLLSATPLGPAQADLISYQSRDLNVAASSERL
jgi:hypothetical protein